MNIQELKNRLCSKYFETTDLPLEIMDGYATYKKDNRACKSLNSTLETNYKAVYRTEFYYGKQWKRNDIDWGGEVFYVVTGKNRLLTFTNSEWGSVASE